jgi:hypothetical protein
MGPQGDPGLRGATGATGATGPAGAQMWNSIVFSFTSPAVVSTFTPDVPIRITRVQAQLASSGKCAADLIVTNGTSSYTLLVDQLANDSGAIAVNFAGGTPVRLEVAPSSSCDRLGARAAQANVVVQYRAQ